MRAVATFILSVVLLASGCATSKTKEFKESYPTREQHIANQAEKLFREGHLSRAEKRFRLALSMHQKKDDLKESAKIYNRLGAVSIMNGDLKKARRFIESAKVIVSMEKFQEALSETLLNETSLAIAEGAIKKASSILKEVEEMRSPDIGIETDNLAGIILTKRGKFQEAEARLNAALEAGKKLNSPAALSSARANLGTLYLEKGEPIKAIEQLKEALAIDKENGFSLLIAQNLHQIGKAYESTGDYKNAIYFYNRALHVNMNFESSSRVKADREAIKRVEALLK